MNQQLILNKIPVSLEPLKPYKSYIYTGAVGLGLFYCAKKIYNYYSYYKYKYPVEIKFGKHDKYGGLCLKKKDFIELLKKNHEESLRLLKESYPNECTLTLDNSCCLTSFLDGLPSKPSSSQFSRISHSSKKIIFLNSVDAIKRFSMPDKMSNCSDPIGNRPKNLIFDIISKHYLGTFFRMNDDRLKEARKSSINGLHLLVNKNQGDFSAKFVNEFKELMRFLDNNFIKQESSLDLSALPSSKGVIDEATIYLQQFTTNLILLLGLDARFPYETDKKCAVKQQIRSITQLLSSMNIVDFTQFSKFDMLMGKLNDAGKLLNEIYTFLLNNFKSYKTALGDDSINLDDTETIKTFADYVIWKQQEKIKKGQRVSSADCYSNEDILVQFFTLFMAGAVTLGFTTMWAFYYLSSNKSAQEKIYNEINSFLDSYDNSQQSILTVEDDILIVKQRDAFKYTNACLDEILRLSSTQATLPRSTTSHDVSIDNGSYYLPGDTTVVVNLFAVHRDLKFYPDEPNEFKPERWLNQDNSNGNVVTTRQRNDSFLPFGLAPRTCFGDTLSKNVMMNLIVNLVKNYDLDYIQSEASASTMSSSLGKLGAMRRPYFYNLRIKRRSLNKK